MVLPPLVYISLCVYVMFMYDKWLLWYGNKNVTSERDGQFLGGVRPLSVHKRFYYVNSEWRHEYVGGARGNRNFISTPPCDDHRATRQPFPPALVRPLVYNLLYTDHRKTAPPRPSKSKPRFRRMQMVYSHLALEYRGPHDKAVERYFPIISAQVYLAKCISIVQCTFNLFSLNCQAKKTRKT